MSTELAYEASDEASESELLERSLSVWKGLTSIDLEDFAPTTLDIHTACSVGHNEWVRSIILKGGDPGLDRRNRGGWTPLMYACYIGHDNIVNLLISAGCNMNMKNSKGHTPLMLAASCGNESVARTLVRKGAELELMDKTGWTALFHATYAGHQNFVAFLLEAGANKDAIEPSSGTTPFMEASAEGHEIIVQLLLQHGVNVNAKAHNGCMARSLALMNGNMKVVSLIDNNVLPGSCLRSEPGLDIYLSSSEEARPQRHHPPSHNKRLKSKGPSIRDGPEAIARMIDRTRHTEPVLYSNLLVPKGYVSFPVGGADKEDTKMSYRDVTSPINPEDYKDSSDSRALSDLDDFNDDSNAFTKTGAITIKSSSSSSGGLVAALGLSRESSLDSDDSHSYGQAGTSSYGHADTSSDDVRDDNRFNGGSSRFNNSVADDGPVLTGQNPPSGHWIIPSNEISSIESIRNHPSSIEISNNQSTFVHTPSGDNEKAESNIKPDNGVVSPLRDYFPSDSSFLVETPAPASSECKVSNGKLWHLQHQSAPSSSCERALPKDNMTQVEIVNRFLKNLTVNNPETSAGQNRWADEASDQSTNDDDLSDASPCPRHFEGLNATSEYEQNNNSMKQLLLSNIEQRSNDNMLNQNRISDKTNLFQKSEFEVAFEQQTEADRKTPKNSSSTKVPSNVQPQTHHSQRSNHSNNQKDPHEHSPNQPWSQHPRLSHHHPRHNRNHHHNSLSNRPDSSLNSIRQAPPITTTSSPTPDINHADMPPSIAHNLPQNYYYSDIETASHSHQQYLGQTSEAPIHPPAEIISQFDINSELDSSPNLLFNLANPSPSNPRLGLYGTAETAISESVPPGSQIKRAPSQHISGSHDVNQTEYKSQDYNPTQLPVQSANRKHQLQSLDNPSQSSSVQASIIIPGHVTSQPVCSTIDWSLAGQAESHGPRDLAEMLTQLGLMKYLDKFVEQDVDLQVFLSMTDNDLKELGVKLFGPRKKMTNAIARWHSSAPLASNSLELAYADKLEGEMQELAIQLNQACGNEERLKAQVLQEQQLRSVTESCLMEERASWEEVRQILLSAKTKLRTVGDLTSRLRLCHRELRKHFEDVSKQRRKDNTESNARQISPTAVKSLDRSNESHVAVVEAHGESDKRLDNVVKHFCADSGDLLKRSEKYFKEMQQTLTSVVAGMDHLLKSSTTVSNIDKLRPQT